MVAETAESPAVDTVYEPPVPTLKTDRTAFVSRLIETIARSDKRLAPFRRSRHQVLRKFCGPYYGHSASGGPLPEHQPLAKIYSYVTIIAPLIGLTDLTCDFSSDDPAQQRTALMLSQDVTSCLKRIQAAKTYGELVVDSMFGPTVAKIAMPRVPIAGQREFTDWRADWDLPLYSRASLDNYILDPDCARREAAELEGDIYHVAVDDAWRAGWDRKGLDAMETFRRHHGSDPQAADITAGRGTGQADELYPHYEVADLWLPREGPNGLLAVVAPYNAGILDFLHVEEWEGPEGGMYRMLGYEYPPDNPFPLAPLNSVRDLDAILNALGTKAKHQADRMKTVFTYLQQHTDAADNIRRAPDGEFVGVADPKTVAAVTYPGPTKELYEAIETFGRWLNENGPNPDMLGGLEASARTLGQDQLKYANASTRLGRMRGQAYGHLVESVGNLAWWLYQRDGDDRVLTMPLEGGAWDLSVEWPAAERREALDRVNWDLELYSHGPASPEDQYRGTMELVQAVMVPLAANAAAQGVYVDVEALVRDLARRRHILGVNQWFRRAQPQTMAGPAVIGGDRNSVNLGGRGIRTGNAMAGTPGQSPRSTPS